MRRTQFVDIGPFYVSRGAMRGTYRLPRRPRIGADYRDAKRGQPVRSAGRALTASTGVVAGRYYASADDRFTTDPAFECVWVR